MWAHALLTVLCCSRNQFGARDTPSGARKTSKQDVAGSSKKGRKAKDAKLKEPNASGGWACPKKSAVSVIPKDAGKRRVHANDRQSGHWFTDESGRKVGDTCSTC